MKQDMNGVRTAQDIERKYNLSSLVTVKKNTELNTEGINKVENELTEFANLTTQNINNLQEQIDGSISTYYYSGVPTMSNPPVSEWDVADYNKHLGDLYFDKDTGYAYRFYYDNDTSLYGWVKITDEDVTEALALAQHAQDTADGKRRVFTITPFTPYDIGDLWLNNNELYVCNVAKTSSQSYSVSDFEIATKYTDDTALTNFISNDYNEEISTINEQLDKKAETWYQSTDPSSSWTTAEIKAKHVGDLWYNTTENKNYTYLNNYSWEEIDGVPDRVYDQIDGKSQIFTSQPTPPYHVGDLYTQGTAGDILVCRTERLTGNYTSSDWQKAGKYTDDTELNNFVNVTYTEAMAAMEAEIDEKVTSWYYSGTPTLSNAPANAWTTTDIKDKHLKDLYYDKATGYTYIFDKTSNVYSWVRIEDNDIIEAMALANAAQDTADGKRQVFVLQPTPPYDNGDLWINNQELYVCQIAKASGTYAEGDFIIATKYTDDTLATQVGNDLIIVKGQVTTVSEKANGLEVVITENTSMINSVTEEVVNEIDERSAMIRLRQEQGIPVVELGTTESPVKTMYKNDGMYIQENGQTTSYYKNGKAYTKDMEATNSLTIGRFAWQPRANGNTSLVYLGGDE